MKVKVENYQSISKAEIEIKGLTVITGQNNTGKSAMARAIMGAFNNQRGTSFVRLGSPICRVEIEFEDGNYFIWSKGKNTNQYEINGKLIQKIGTDVPTEILDLNVKSVLVDGKEIHPQFAKQFQQVFLIDLPPSSLASALSDVDIIQKLEQAIQMVKSDTNSLSSKNKFKLEDLAKEKTKLEAFDGLENLDATILKIEHLEIEIEKLNLELNALKELEAKRCFFLGLLDDLAELSLVCFNTDTNGLSDVILNLETLRILSLKKYKLTQVLTILEDTKNMVFNPFLIDPLFATNLLSDLRQLSYRKIVLEKAIGILADLDRVLLTSLENDPLDLSSHLEILKTFKAERVKQEKMLKLEPSLDAIQFSIIDFGEFTHLDELKSLKREYNKNFLILHMISVGIGQVNLSDASVLEKTPLLDFQVQKIELENSIKQVQTELEFLELELNTLKTEIGDTCPLCQQANGCFQH
jgi:energy-coupling factor transporter ATP-binding protein EcfA2